MRNLFCNFAVNKGEIMETTIKLMDHVSGTSTNAEGYSLYIVLAKELAKDTLVKLSFSEATPMSTSFLNSSFGELMDNFGLEAVKKNIRLINFQRTEAERIQKYLKMVSSH
jgi:hypothetical protein